MLFYLSWSLLTFPSGSEETEELLSSLGSASWHLSHPQASVQYVLLRYSVLTMFGLFQHCPQDETSSLLPWQNKYTNTMKSKCLHGLSWLSVTKLHSALCSPKLPATHISLFSLLLVLQDVGPAEIAFGGDDPDPSVAGGSEDHSLFTSLRWMHFLSKSERYPSTHLKLLYAVTSEPFPCSQRRFSSSPLVAQRQGFVLLILWIYVPWPCKPN